MNNKILNVCVFLAGVAIGSVATNKFFKNKYEQIAKEEIESVKETFSKKKTVAPAEKENPTQEADYKSMVRDLKYDNHSDTKEEEEKAPCKRNDIYVIPPSSVGERDGYEITTLTYYADGILTDELDQVVEDIDELIGEGSLTHFGEYEDDSVHVRNDSLQTDFEILRDLRNYSDVMSTSNHPEEED